MAMNLSIDPELLDRALEVSGERSTKQKQPVRPAICLITRLASSRRYPVKRANALANSMRRVRLTGPARRDISRALQRSSVDFGAQVRDRYRRLLDQDLMDIGEDPSGTGMRAIGDVREGHFIYHIRSSTEGTPKPAVQQPRRPSTAPPDDLGS